LRALAARGSRIRAERWMREGRQWLYRRPRWPWRAGPRLGRCVTRDRGWVTLRCGLGHSQKKSVAWVRPEVGDDHRVSPVGGWTREGRNDRTGPLMGCG
jgi:hypothetical protein